MDFTNCQENLKYEELPDTLVLNDFNDITNNTFFTTALSSYLKEIARYPSLTYAEEQELAKKIKNGDKEAKEKFINSNLKLVVFVAKKYQTEKFELLDLIQEGNMGLLKAVEMFDYTKGFKFSTYAIIWIKQYILRAYANKGNFIRVPIYIQTLIIKYKSVQKNFYILNGREANDVEVSKEMHISIDEVKELKSYMYNAVSLNSPVSTEDDSELGDFIQDIEPTPEEVFIKSSNRELLNFLIANSNLTELEKEVIKLRYNYESQDSKNLESVAKITKKNKERVRMIERKALTKLRYTAKSKLRKEFM